MDFSVHSSSERERNGPAPPSASNGYGKELFPTQASNLNPPSTEAGLRLRSFMGRGYTELVAAHA